MSTTTPLRRPLEGLEPTPMIFSMPSSVTSDTIAQIFVVPISNPTRICSRFATASPPLPENHPVVVSQVDVLSFRLTSVKCRHTKGRPHGHEPLPLLLEPFASEMKSHALCRGDEVYGVADIHLDTAVQCFRHRFGQFNGGLQPLS